MITYVLGDLFTSPASVLVNTVNTVGVMGKGLAKEFKTYYPEMFQEYQKLCEEGSLTIGSLYLYQDVRKSVLNFPTKRHWRQMSRIEDIDAGLQTFATQYAAYGITDVAFPQLGCGNGELNWETQVRPFMERHLRDLPIDIYIHIYEDHQRPEHRDTAEMKRWLRSEPASLSFREVLDDLRYQLAGNAAYQGWTISIDGHERPDPSFTKNDRHVVMPYDDGLDLWQQLRSFGFLEIGDVPIRYRDIANSLFGALLSLPYIEPAKFASGLEEQRLFTRAMLDEREIALQLVPPVAKTRRPSYRALELMLP